MYCIQINLDFRCPVFGTQLYLSWTTQNNTGSNEVCVDVLSKLHMFKAVACNWPLILSY